MKITLNTEQAVDLMMEAQVMGDAVDSTIGEAVMMRDACRAIVEYYDGYEEDTGETVSFDAVAIRCEWTGLQTLDEAAELYEIDTGGVEKDDRDEFILEYLQEHTAVLHISGDHYIWVQF